MMPAHAAFMPSGGSSPGTTSHMCKFLLGLLSKHPLLQQQRLLLSASAPAAALPLHSRHREGVVFSRDSLSTKGFEVCEI